ncbi:MAG: TadE/TadG family type IV pilus assembly protein [Pseudomonadota bacterium]
MRQLPIPGVFAPRWQRKFETLCDDNRGMAAVEFALIAVPFFFLIFGLLEVCVIFIMSSILEHAASEASRQIRTGQLQNAGLADAAMVTSFRQDVCDELFGLMSCDATRLKTDVQVFADFGATGSTPALEYDATTGDLEDNCFGFSAGGQNQIVVIRVFYEWNLIIPVLSAPLANMSNNRLLLQSTVAFRNEPFGNSGSGGPGVTGAGC